MSGNPVLVVEDDRNLREALVDTLELAGFPVIEADNGESALDLVRDQEVGMVLTDYQLGGMSGQTLLERLREYCPRIPVLMMTAFGTVEGAVRAMRAGAQDYLTKPFDPDTLVQHVGRLLGLHRDTLENLAEDSLIAEDPVSRSLLELARRVAESDVTVMLTGESGSGKEVFARYVHQRSRRHDGPFVAINCAAIPEQMLEATLFGYEKGAFTGAWRSTPGKLEQAGGGTLLLDEISEMQLGLQAKLLRVLQEREVERLGGQKTLKLDLRVLATSNRDMGREVAEGRFREDLFYRLNVFNLKLPPLRERRGDILPLARRLILRAWNESGPGVPEMTQATQRALLAHHWSGNVRELDNTVQRALVLAGGADIRPEHLMLEPAPGGLEPAEDQSESSGPSGSDLRSREQQAIVDVLVAVCGNRSEAARRLDVSPRTLRYKLARMRAVGIAIPGDSCTLENRS